MVKTISNWQKIQILLWKNFMLQCNKTNIFNLILEMVFPILLCAAVFSLLKPAKPTVQAEKRFSPSEPLRTLLGEYEPFPILAYSPQNELLENIMKDALKLANSLQAKVIFDHLEVFDSAQNLERAAATTNFTVCVQFPNDFAHLADYPRKFEFKLRFPSFLRTYKDNEFETWHTSKLYPEHYSMGSRNDYDNYTDGQPIGYFNEGFLFMQHVITMAYIGLASKQTNLPTVMMQRFPYPSYVADFGLVLFEHVLPFLLVAGFVVSLCAATEFVAIEKEKQLKEVMKIMGAPNWTHWMAWILRTLMVYGIICIILAVLVKVPARDGYAFLIHSDGLLIFVFLWLYTMASNCFFFMMSSFFKSAITTVVAAQIAFLLTYVPIYIIEPDYDEMNLAMKLLLCLSINIAIAFAIKIIVNWEYTHEGANWSNLFEAVNEDDTLTLGHLLIMMMIAACLYMIICLYVEQVFPGEFGVPKVWYFPFQRDFWCSNTARRKSLEDKSSRQTKRDNPLAFEEEPRDKRAGVEIRSLGKRFKNVWAVKNLSLKMYEDEITVLLGHNGAGKTTVISMLTGMFPPTTGTAIINDYDISTETEYARASMGICPQHNILFDSMTVANHLKFYARLKGLQGSELKTEIEKFLERLQLKNKADEPSSTLSGGMKRKLSLCCALCGGAKVVFCDEPSSGMDTQARRQLWDMLQSEKKGRTVLLTTHFMEEADVLGDRIAIMCHGFLKCHGTSFFLKKKFGAGYKLICVKTADCDVQGVTKLLGKYIPEIQPESEIGTELTYRLPDEFSRIFSSMLRDLEKNMKSLGLLEFGLGVTSMEEVFMKVGAEDADAEKDLLSKHDSNVGSQRKSGGEDEKPGKKRTSTEEAGKKRTSTEEAGKKRASSEESSYASTSSFHSDKDRRSSKKRRSMSENPEKGTTESDSSRTSEEKERNSRKGRQRKSSEVDNQPHLPKLRREEDINGDISMYNSIKNQSGSNRNLFNDNDEESQNYINSEGHSLTCNHWHAMMYKKVLHTWRSKSWVLLINLAAIILVVLGMSIAAPIILRNEPPMTFTLKQYARAVLVLEVTPNIEPNSNGFGIADQYAKSAQLYNKDHKVEKTEGTDMQEYILKLGKSNPIQVEKIYLVGATVKENEITAWYNNQPLHMTPLALNLVHNAMARHFIAPDAEIIATNHPLFQSIHMEAVPDRSLGSMMMVFEINYALLLTIAYYAILPIKERTSKFKLLQFVGGVRAWTHWLTHFLWDLFMGFITISLIILTMKLYNLPEYSTAEMLSYYFLLMLVFLFAALPLTYVLSGFFKRPSTGYQLITFIYMIFGFGLGLGLWFLPVYWPGSENHKGLIDLLWYAFSFLPPFSLACALVSLGTTRSIEMRCEETPGSHECKMGFSEYFATGPKGNLTKIYAMLITGVVLIASLIIYDHGCLWRFVPAEQQLKRETHNEIDDDVKAESDRVSYMTQEDIANCHLVLDHIKKRYFKVKAVKDISLSVKSLECFGLLGVNGAGKTTTFKILTGDERIFSGDAYVTGTSVRNDLAGVYRKIGYCPQYDGLLLELTGRETLFIFCLLRGVSRNRIKIISEELADAFGFTKHIDKPIKALSGGNKRKLSTAIAVLGSPEVIYLDEPTSGMDPATQRKIWNMVCLIRDSGKLIVLTTHSMGEVEVLCTKVSIMVNGEFKCIGSLQHLKSKFSKGFVLKIQAERQSTSGETTSSELETKVTDIKNAVLAQYPLAQIESEYHGMLTIYVPTADIKWSDIFDWMESKRSNLKIEDYSISQTSLEEIFLDFASKQVEDIRQQ